MSKSDFSHLASHVFFISNTTSYVWSQFKRKLLKMFCNEAIVIIACEVGYLGEKYHDPYIDYLFVHYGDTR